MLVADLASFTRAAAALNSSQAAVSLKIRRLEEALGRRLLDRTPRFVRLSADGANFLGVARELIAAQQKALGAFATPQRRIAASISHHIVGADLPTWLQFLHRSDPGLVVEVRIETTREAIATLEAGHCDCAIVLNHDGKRRGGDLLFKEEFRWTAAPDFEWRPGDVLPLATQAAPCSVRAMTISALEKAGVAWAEVFVGGGVETIGAAARAGLAVAALARRVAPLGTVDVSRRLACRAFRRAKSFCCRAPPMRRCAKRSSFWAGLSARWQGAEARPRFALRAHVCCAACPARLAFGAGRIAILGNPQRKRSASPIARPSGSHALTNTSAALDYDAIIIGAGISGLYQLYRLRTLGMKVRVFEAGTGVGGTWYWNRYPGARFDSESYSYGFSFSQELLDEWHWTEHFSPQPQTLKYLNFVADKFDLRRDIQFRSRVTAAHYRDDEPSWQVTLEDGSRHTARFLVTAIGPLSAPTMPRIEGIESFKGQSCHTARWPHEPVSFEGKRVAVIGTGATACRPFRRWPRRRPISRCSSARPTGARRCIMPRFPKRK